MKENANEDIGVVFNLNLTAHILPEIRGGKRESSAQKAHVSFNFYSLRLSLVCVQFDPHCYM